MPEELSLAELADASGLHPRTIRSWVAQGLLPGPLSRGPAARYPGDQLERILAIRTMKELHGMSLADIRQELLIAPADRIAALAQKAPYVAPEQSGVMSSPPVPPTPPDADPDAALDYFRALRAGPPKMTQRSEPSRAYGMARIGSAPRSLSETSDTQYAPDTPATEPPKRAAGFEALEQRLLQSATRAPTERRPRAEERLTIEITPDVELSVRGKLDADQRARLERCAELMRDILTGRE